MSLVEQYWNEHPDEYEELKALKERSKALSKRRRKKAYERLLEVERFKEKLYGRK